MKKLIGITIMSVISYTLQAQSLGDVDLSRFVYGDNQTKTSYFNNPNDLHASGFFNQYTETNMPYKTWWHMIINRHMNTDNNYQFQIAADFFNDNTYFRKINNGNPAPWRRILNDGQDAFAANLNQNLRTTDNVTFATVYAKEIHFFSDDKGWGTDNSDPYTLRKVHDALNVSHLDLNLNDDADESFRIYGYSCNGYGCGTYSGNLYHSFDASGNVYHAGSVGIGTTAPDQKLTVNGKIHAQEVIVDLNVPVADYVFSKDYKLMPLPEVEQYVQTNSHLPEIPSAAEVKEKGMSMGEMQNQLLKKVEELTLYVIQQDKRIHALEEENQRLKK